MKYYKIGESYGKLEEGQKIETSHEIFWLTKQEYETETGEIVIEPKLTVVELIRKRFSMDDELAIQRQKETKPEEFQAYFDYVELCKTQLRNE